MRKKLVCGVYRIRCQSSGMSYIRASINITKRWGEHRSTIKRGKLGRCAISNKASDFTLEIIEECSINIRIDGTEMDIAEFTALYLAAPDYTLFRLELPRKRRGDSFHHGEMSLNVAVAGSIVLYDRLSKSTKEVMA